MSVEGLGETSTLGVTHLGQASSRKISINQIDNVDSLSARIRLRHASLPELNFSDVSLSLDRFGESVATPFLLTALAMDESDARQINPIFAQACEARGWSLGVGSSARHLVDPSAAQEWQRLRRYAQHVPLFASISLTDLIQSSVDSIQRLVGLIEAKGVVVYTKPLQDCLAAVEKPDYTGGLQALERLCQQLTCPVILQETGAGLTKASLHQLKGIGLAGVDICGKAVKPVSYRQPQTVEEARLERAAETFVDWGVDTVDSLLNAQAIEPDFAIWVSGHWQTGLEAAKCLALGATTVGFIQSLQQMALQSYDSLLQTMATIELECKIALFCCGCKDIADLQARPVWEHIE